jgi:hypothetical protein
MCGAISLRLTSLRRAVGAVGGHERGLYAEARLGSLQHCSRRSNLRLSDGARSFDIDNHPMVGVDQVVVGIGEESMSFVRACPLGRRIGSRDELRRHRRCSSKRRIV